MKSRGVYETPGGTVLLHAHRAIESITIDKGEAHIKDEIMPKYAEIIYNGYWFSSERKALQNLIDSTQENVNGEVRIKIFKGNIIILGRRSLTVFMIHPWFHLMKKVIIIKKMQKDLLKSILYV